MNFAFKRSFHVLTAPSGRSGKHRSAAVGHVCDMTIGIIVTLSPSGMLREKRDLQNQFVGRRNPSCNLADQENTDQQHKDYAVRRTDANRIGETAQG